MSVNSSTARFSTLPLSSVNTLELFPDPDVQNHPPCTCTCRHAKNNALSETSDGEKEDETKKDESVTEIWKEFSGDTSMHGIKYIFHGPLIVRVIFCLLMLLFVGKLMLQLKESVEQYNSRPTSTKIQLADADGPPNIRFPTVSVCSHNPVRKSYLNRNPGLGKVWKTMDYSDTDTIQGVNWNAKPFSLYRNFTYAQILTDGGPSLSNFMQCEHFLDLCHRNPTLGSEYVERELSVSGNCYRINPKGKLFGKGGDFGKLSLKFFADVNEYVEGAENMAQFGYAIAFHDHEQYSGSLPTSFWMSPGIIYKADLSLTTEYRLTPPTGKCNDTVLYNTYGRHEENSCLAQCRDDEVLRRCGCVKIPPPLPENNPGVEYRACTLEEWSTCGLQAYLDWYKAYVDVRRADMMCHCYPACKENFYKASISSSALSKIYAARRVSQLPEGYGTTADVLDNLMVLDILFTSTQQTEITEIATYGWMNFLGDVGGVMGLFLGASAFTVIEIIVFAFTFCWKAAKLIVKK